MSESVLKAGRRFGGHRRKHAGTFPILLLQANTWGEMKTVRGANIMSLRSCFNTLIDQCSAFPETGADGPIRILACAEIICYITWQNNGA